MQATARTGRPVDRAPGRDVTYPQSAMEVRPVQMKETEAVELVETTPLEGLADLQTGAGYTHVDFLGRELPGPVALYPRWERQQGSASAIDFSAVRAQR